MSEERHGPITLLICDDHRVLTDAFVAFLADEPAVRLVADPVAEGERAVELAVRLRPAVVLMDVVLRGPMDGLEATRRIREGSPETSVVILTGHADDRVLLAAVEAGATGFLEKSRAAEDVLSVIVAAARGEVLIEPGNLARVVQRMAEERRQQDQSEMLLRQLTARERQLLALLADGLSTEVIAARLSITPQTAQTHVRNILAKLGVHSRLQAVAFAASHGAVRLPAPPGPRRVPGIG